MTSILEIQKRLLALGFALPKFGADGLAGAETAAAIRAFQATNGLSPTGRADEATFAKLFPDDDQPTTATGKATTLLAKQPKTLRSVVEVIVHCTATPEGRDVSVETIRGWHKAQGWSDIGYHYVVKLDGSIEVGRPEMKVGSHVAGHNTGTMGVVYVGGVEKDGKTPKDTRTPTQKEALLALVRALIAKYPTIKKVTGHNQYAAKACPSFDVRKDALGSLI